MLIYQNFQIAMEQLWASKARSVLTMVGMIIAVASTITVVSVVLGFSRHVAEFLKSWGTNAVWVAPDRPAGEAGRTLGRAELDIRDVESVMERCEALRLVSPNTRQNAVSIRYGRDEATAPLEGISVEYHAIRKFEVETGRPFAVVDVEQSHQVCIVGRDILRKLNVDDELVGQSLLLDGRRFHVVGILKEKARSSAPARTISSWSLIRWL